MRIIDMRSAKEGGVLRFGLALLIPVLLAAMLAGIAQARTKAVAGKHARHAKLNAASYQYGNGGAVDGTPRYGGGGSRREVMGDPRRAVLRAPNVSLYGGPRRDVARGIARQSVLRVIEFASRRHEIAVSAVKTGHPYGSEPTLRRLGYGGYPNSHYFGRAVDIAAVDGVPVSPTNLVAKRLARRIEARFQPQELGTPWNLRGPGTFTNADHKDHIHVGWAYGR